MSDTTELFTGSSGTSEASPGPDHGSPGTAAPAGETVTDKPTRRGGSGLSGMLLADLQRLAQSMGITGTARMRKGQLVEAIQARQEGGAAYAREDGGGGHRERGGPVNGQQAAGSRRRATGVRHTTTQSSVARLREPAHLASVSRTPWSQIHLLSPLWATPGTLCAGAGSSRHCGRRAASRIPRGSTGRWARPGGPRRPARVRRAGHCRGGPERPGPAGRR